MRPVIQMTPQLAPTAVAQAYPRRARTGGVNLPCLSDEGPRRLCRGVLSSELAVPRGRALVVFAGGFWVLCGVGGGGVFVFFGGGFGGGRGSAGARVFLGPLFWGAASRASTSV